MKRFLVLILLLACTLAFSQAKKTTAADPWAGTFKLDTAKSKMHPPAPKEETVTVDAASKDSVKYTINGTGDDGSPYSVTFDGKAGTASPQMANGKEVAQITYQMPNSHEFTSTSKAADGSSSTAKITLSKDGKTITVQEHNKSSAGEFDQTAVYVRQ
ncbi:MAG TPA: hypothetical protein VKH81_21880 [Candidatus Angelobacter sp.]|nr:hypothetical protein [Candidatus Angelobacter sp.]